MHTQANTTNPTHTHRAADMLAAASKIVRVTANSLGIELKMAADQVKASADAQVRFA
jgi:hypothetical protein